MGELLKNVRVLGAAVGAIGLTVALGVYEPGGDVQRGMVALVGLGGGAAVGAVIAAVAKRFGKGEAPKA